MAKICKIFILLICIPAFIFAQNKNIRFEHITVDDGLSSNSINCILQDSKGFLWFGTSNGLNRYDGNTIRIFQNDPEDTNSVGDNRIQALHEDIGGNILIGTFSEGLDVYDPITETFSHFKYSKQDTNCLCNNNITLNALFEDKKGNIWIGTANGLSMMTKIKGEKIKAKYNFENYIHKPDDAPTFHTNVFWSLFEDNKKNIWVGSQDGSISKIDNVNKKLITIITSDNIQRFFYKNNPNRDPGAAFNIFHEDSDPDFILTIGSSKEIYKYNLKENKFIDCFHDFNELVSTRTPNIRLTYKKNDDRSFWIGSVHHGLFLINDWKNDFILYKHNPNDYYSISPADINSIYKDRQGITWIGTSGGGINKFDPNKQNFITYRIKFKNKKIYIMSILKDPFVDDIFWIGTASNGLIKYDRNTNYIKSFPGKIKNPVSVVVQDMKNKNYLWIGDLGTGIHKFDKNSQRFIKTFYPGQSLSSEVDVQLLASSNIIREILTTNNGDMWIATHYGLYHFNPWSEKFTPYTTSSRDNDNLSTNQLIELYTRVRSEDSTIWIGTYNDGLNKLNPSTGEISFFKNDPSNPNSLMGSAIYNIYEDEDGLIWIGTNKGLNKFDYESNSFYHIIDNNKSLNTGIKNIFKDKYGYVWLNTSEGLCKFNPTEKTVRYYDQNSGFPFQSIYRYSIHRDKNRNVYIGGYGGFVEFNPDNFVTNTYIPPIVITDFQIFNKSIKLNETSLLNKSISYSNEIVLSHKQSVFSFEFSALDFSDPGKNKYAYKMEGVNPDWVYTDASRRFATYTQLEPGEYTFKVKGSNNDGIWNEEGTSIKIIIIPPWWQANWAYTFYVLMIGLLVYFIWRFQTNRLKMKHQLVIEHLQTQKLEEIDQIKSQFFTNISHEFRTPLTLIKGPSKLILDNVKDEQIKENAKLIYRNSEKLNKLVNQILDISKIEAGEMQLKASRINVIELLKDILRSFASYAESKKIKIDFKSKKSEIMVFLDIEKFEKIINNIISNALKYTAENGDITVSVSQLTDFADIKISDTGIGIPKDLIPNIFDRFYQVGLNQKHEFQGTGIGLALTKELISLHKGRIEVDSEEGEGTTFTLSFPLGKDHLYPNQIIKPFNKRSEVDESVMSSEFIEHKIHTIDKDELIIENDVPSVLVVEDNPDVRQYIKNYLEAYYKILQALDGEDGFNKSIEYLPDVIISDVMMPKMDGFQLTDKLKNDQRTSHIPVILLTAKATSNDKMEGYEYGADDYIMKPFDVQELNVRVKNFIDQRKRLRQHFQKEAIFSLENKDITNVDKKFLQKAIDIIKTHLSDTSFGVESFASELAMNRISLYKKTMSLVGEPPGDLIKRIRLSNAANLIKNKTGNISEIALEVGFTNPAYFSECFKKQFGIVPSKY